MLCLFHFCLEISSNIHVDIDFPLCTFRKGRTPSWSTSSYKIAAIHVDRPLWIVLLMLIIFPWRKFMSQFGKCFQNCFLFLRTKKHVWRSFSMSSKLLSMFSNWCFWKIIWSCFPYFFIQLTKLKKTRRTQINKYTEITNPQTLNRCIVQQIQPNPKSI